MKITFVLPGYQAYAAGGFKVVYEYANRLQARGHQLTLIHPRYIEPQSGLTQAVKARWWPQRIKWRDQTLPPWFALNPTVRFELIPDLRERFIPAGDAVVATGYRTANWVNGYARDKGRKFYFIQHHETWDGAEREVNQTWTLPLHKIVIAQWLLRLARELGEAERVTYIPNGLNFSEFHLTTPLAKRQPARIGMMAHSFPWKGTADGLAALALVKAEFPELEAVLFGVHARPTELPAWMEYRQRPGADELRALYNSCALFLHPSWVEGWGLPAAEAMACGCALVAANSRGVEEFVTDGATALLAPVKDPAALAACVLRLLRDRESRQQLAEAGTQAIQAFTWERSVAAWETLLQEPCSERTE
jgi:glycosyltransferase involved in cell wall biosynthesis